MAAWKRLIARHEEGGGRATTPSDTDSPKAGSGQGTASAGASRRAPHAASDFSPVGPGAGSWPPEAEGNRPGLLEAPEFAAACPNNENSHPG